VATNPEEHVEQATEVRTQDPAKVIMFNDDFHTFEEVITQLIKALRCTQSRAEGYAAEAHTNGRAIVYTGELTRCIEISGILEEIQLMTQIEV
jgi:ATP-dependent Clp protease adaptor protein ClpS